MNWCRLYNRALHDAKIQTLPVETRWRWVECLMLASASDPRGRLPQLRQIAFAMRVTLEEASEVVDSLVAAALIDRNPDGTLTMHDWDRFQPTSDDAAGRMRKARAEQAFGTSSEHVRPLRNSKKTRNAKPAKQEAPKSTPENDIKNQAPSQVTSETKNVFGTCSVEIRGEEIKQTIRAEERLIVDEGVETFETTIIVAAELFGDRLGDSVRAQRRRLEAALDVPNRWDCLCAALRATRRQANRGGKPIDDVIAYAVSIAQEFAVDGIPAEAIRIATKTIVRAEDRPIENPDPKYNPAILNRVKRA